MGNAVVTVLAVTVAKIFETLTPPGVGVFYYDTLDSTNSEAQRLLEAGALSQGWIIAERQTKGRGRRGRVWTSERGNFFATYVWQPENQKIQMNYLPFAVSLAVYETLCMLGGDGHTIKLKWPNDVLVNDKKIAGVLIEASHLGSQKMSILIGIGINVMSAPTDTIFPATNLTECGFGLSDTKPILKCLATCLDDKLRLLSNHPIDILNAWCDRAWGMGKHHIFQLNDKKVTGKAIEVEYDGALRVSIDAGEEIRLYAGDIFPLMPE